MKLSKIKPVHINLHSTVVLLKETVAIVGLFLATTFTFYCSSIKSMNPVLIQTVAIVFTFYCSSIKSSIYLFTIFCFCLFTFYCSSIKRIILALALGHIKKFTFYCSSIKSEIQEKKRQRDLLYLHSTVVLLKGG